MSGFSCSRTPKPRRPEYVTACRLAQRHARKPFSVKLRLTVYRAVRHHRVPAGTPHHARRSLRRSQADLSVPAISGGISALSSLTRRCSPAPASSGPDTTPHPLMPARPGAGGRAAGRRTESPRDTLGRPLRSAICHGRPARISPVVLPAAFRRPQRRKGAPRNGERITPTPPDHSRLKVGAEGASEIPNPSRGPPYTGANRPVEYCPATTRRACRPRRPAGHPTRQSHGWRSSRRSGRGLSVPAISGVTSARSSLTR